jgi:alpha-glucan,water dikinase
MPTNGRADRRGRPRFEQRARVQAVAEATEVEICVEASERVVLHWGVAGQRNEAWQCPPEAVWPAGTRPVDARAVQTPFPSDSRKLVLRLPFSVGARSLLYVFHFPQSNRWDNCHGRDYCLELGRKPGDAATLADRLAAWAPGAGDWEKHYSLGEGELGVRVRLGALEADVWLVTDLAGPVVLHWGLGYGSPSEWRAPPAECLPSGTSVVSERAAQTPFDPQEGLQMLRLSIPRGPGELPRTLNAVIYQAQLDRWVKDGAEDFRVRLFPGPSRGITLERPELADLAEPIVAAEVGRGSWTLMHRFDLCSELLERVGGQVDALALLFVWLRFSAIRQLDWQRRYNTQPRVLAHAQDRLTRRIAGLWRRHPGARPWLRRLLTTVGRGGEGQRIRDDILSIMHRHNIREQAGRFLEQWHQKLHNNTTPDDIAICRAYLEFLRADGQVEAFDRVLAAHGLTRDRLGGYDRPITAVPDFYPPAKAGLIADFSDYLGLLQSVHASTDLGSAVQVVHSGLDDELGGALDELIALPGAPASDPVALLTRSLELGLRVRSLLAERLERATDDGWTRDLLYLDLALADQVRVGVERLRIDELGLEALSRLVDGVVHHLAVGGDVEELVLVARHWRRLGGSGTLVGRDRALHARAIADRMTRVLGDHVAAMVAMLQPKAEELGRALEVDSWTIPLFGEEVVRGSPLFALSRLLGALGPPLRREAALGAWQLVCPGIATGTVAAVDDLLAVQGETYPSPTVLLARVVHGEEEIPPEVVAVLTLDSPDLLSHVAVRARNAGVLIASCYDPAAWAELQAQTGSLLEVTSTPAGDLVWGPGERAHARNEPGPPARRVMSRPGFSRFALAESEFSPESVGGKSCHLAVLRRLLPPWVRIPPSFAIPFGVFEAVLGDDRNRDLGRSYQELLGQLDHAPGATLGELRHAVLGLAPPPALVEVVSRTAQAAGLDLSGAWDQCWQALKAVWASQWNDRAYHARRAQGMDHADLRMAVLVQPVVPADYAFVLHTINPLTRQKDELYGEVVWGLGETLVGNHPGRALSFVAPKPAGSPRVVGYPSKSHALRAEGLIFRSDSNAEDLTGYAGAGLYDSVTTGPSRTVLLDYSAAPLLWDPKLVAKVLDRMAEVGRVVEELLGGPQDVEGAWADEAPFLLQARPQVGLG